MMKPPLGTIHSSGPSSGVTTYKYTRSRDDPLNSKRDDSSLGSFRSATNQNPEELRKSSAQSSSLKNGRTINTATSANSYSIAASKNYPGSTKKGVSSKLAATLPKSSGYRKFGSTSEPKGEDPSKKYAKIPKSILKASSSQDRNTDGSVINIRSLECNSSPFRSEVYSCRSTNRPHSGLKYVGSSDAAAIGLRPEFR